MIMNSFEKFLKNLDEFLYVIMKDYDCEQKSFRYSKKFPNGIAINSAFSVKVGILSDLKVPNYKFQLSEKVEPLIDVYRYNDSINITVLLPGITKEAVSTEIKQNQLVIKISKDGKNFLEEIPLNNLKQPLRLYSVNEKNSVIEISFKR